MKPVAVLRVHAHERLPDSLESARQNAESFGTERTTRGQFCRSTVQLYLVKKYFRNKFCFSFLKLKPIAVLLVHAHEQLPDSLESARQNAESFGTERTTRGQFCRSTVQLYLVKKYFRNNFCFLFLKLKLVAVLHYLTHQAFVKTPSRSTRRRRRSCSFARCSTLTFDPECGVNVTLRDNTDLVLLKLWYFWPPAGDVGACLMPWFVL